MNKQANQLMVAGAIFICLTIALNLPEWLYILFKNDVFAEELSLSLPNFFSYPQKSILFQINGDFLLLFLPLLFLRRHPTTFKLATFLLPIFYLLLLYYNIYYYLYQGLYSVHPVFKNDWIIIRDILPTFLNELAVKKGNYLITVAVLVLFSMLCGKGISYLSRFFQEVNKGNQSWLVIALIIGWTGVSILNLEEKKIINEENYFTNKSFLLKWTLPNLIKSWTLNRKEPLAHLKKRLIYDLYLEKPLHQKPNIYLLFIESYGAVATIAEECAPKFDSLSTQLEKQLKERGWHSTSNYTKSTVIGGRSWLALTTAMIGAKIEDQIQYNGLLEDHQDYPHMVEYFNRQGYQTVRASTMSSKDIDTLKMITIPNQFWGFDHRKMFTDIPYEGYRYDYYGGIPDQYTLGYLQAQLLDTISAPYFFTFITMNSHGPWSNAPPITQHWTELNRLQNPFPTGRPELNMSINSYWELMEYELKIITNFIANHPDDNSLFIVLGDHNPAGLEWKLFGKFNKWATPIHLIGKDSTLIQSFEQHGFTEGMQVDTNQYTIMRHMGLYSLLTRQLLEQYGAEEEVLPAYLPWGLK